MDVAFYHDDPSNRLPATVYDPQSSPGSVESFSSTDAGPIRAIATVPFERFDQGFGKSALLKAKTLQSGSTAFSTTQQLAYTQTTEPIVTSGHYQSLGNSFNEAPARSSPPQSFGLNIPASTQSNSAAMSTPEVISMLRSGGTELDQMLSTPQSSQTHSRMSDEMFMQNYSRNLSRQQAHGGSNPDIASSNPCDAAQQSVATSSGVLINQQSPYVSPDFYYNREQSEGPSTSGFGSPATTVHHVGNPELLSMSPHTSGLGSLKDEFPQTVPIVGNGGMSPINMEEQEMIKAERKRLRNRMAASKCRKRKLERISRLEDKVNNLKQQNLELSSNANLLRQQVSELKSKVMAHVNSGCQVMMSQQQLAF